MKHRVRTFIGWLLFIVFGASAIVSLAWGIYLRHDSGAIYSWGSLITGIATIMLATAAIFAGLHAISELQHRTQVEKARWLSDLYRSFFEETKFKEIRRRIDYADLTEIRELVERDLQDFRRSDGSRSPFTEPEKKLLDEFTDFLNFFELIGYLRELDLISVRDVNAIFDYYLKRIKQVDNDGQIRTYLRQLNFECFLKLLDDVPEKGHR